jgi:hypothetical protein
MAHPAGTIGTYTAHAYTSLSARPWGTRQAHHYFKNPQHYVGPRGRHAWDPKLGFGVFK